MCVTVPMRERKRERERESFFQKGERELQFAGIDSQLQYW